MNKKERQEEIVDLISKDVFRESRIENNKPSKPEEDMGMNKQNHHLQCPCCEAFAKINIPPDYKPTEENEFSKSAFFGKVDLPQVVCPNCKNIFWINITWIDE